MKFTVITVTFNAGDKLAKTVCDVLEHQTFDDYEILVKDGLSKDGSLEKLPQNPKLRVISQGDKGIYDAMNQAVELAKGEYVCFMNCGDFFASGDVLQKMSDYIDANPGRGIYYGDTFWEQAQTIQYSASEITDKVCYCNVPCHQSCFFAKALYENDGFDTKYKIRADHDFFLRQYYTKGIKPAYTGFVVAKYEGGGFSETKANRKRNKEEHKAITETYMPKKAITKNKLYLALTLAPVRRYISERSIFAGLYQKLKQKLR